MGKKIDPVGKRYGRLVALRYSHTGRAGSQSVRYFVFRCDCGTEKPMRLGMVTMGRALSCGCLYLESVRTRRLKHGEGARKTKEYRSWMAMKNRCRNPKDNHFYLYGARGIKVCERWQSSFENFLADMGRAPTPKHSIDRINNSAGYSPDNCRWATAAEQNANKRSTHVLDIDGECLTRQDAAKKYGLKYSTLRSRHLAGLTPRQIVGLDPHPTRNYKRMVRT